MSREHKYRAWDIIDGVIIDAVEMHFGTDGIDIVVFDGDSLAYSRRPGQYILMQYTGLKDKNGVEIYCGDLLRFPAKKKSWEETNFCVREVFWHSNDCADKHVGWQMNRCHGQGSCGSDGKWAFMLPKYTKQMIVIGSIHQNPELLK